MHASFTNLLGALAFAAQKHCGQTRKKDAGPFINHPIAVAEILARVGLVSDLLIIEGAFLHDVLEDTETPPQELADRFGAEVLALVQELTDDMSLPKLERKRLQIETAPRLCLAAKQIRIADKICNVQGITTTQPADWSPQFKREYLDWAEQVVNACRGSNVDLERHFDAVLRAKRAVLG